MEKSAVEEAMKSASFDLSCKKESLKGKVLVWHEGAFGQKVEAKVVGITGCGKKARYIYQDGNWILNSANTPS